MLSGMGIGYYEAMTLPGTSINYLIAAKCAANGVDVGRSARTHAQERAILDHLKQAMHGN